MTRERERRTGHHRAELREIARDAADGPRPRAGVRAEGDGGALDRAMDEDGRTVVERMRQWRGRMDPLNAVVRQWQPREER